MTRVPIGLATQAAAALLALGCSKDPQSPVKCTGATEAVYDPYRHTVCMDSCFDALDCPRGTLCVKRDESSTRGSCVVPSDLQQTSHSALLDGFGVGEMSAELRTVGALELAWTAPEGARLVNCVLLACPPAFRIGLGPDEWAAPTDQAAVEIANYDRCTLAAEKSSQPEGLFNLRERDNQHRVPASFTGNEATAEDGATKWCRGYGCPPVSELFAGCWAYDDTTIIAATRLFPIDISLGLYNYHNAFARDDGRCSMKLRQDTTPKILEDSFRTCLRETADDTDGTGGSTGGDPSTDSDGEVADALRYGMCACVTAVDPVTKEYTVPDDTAGNCIDDEPCKRPCRTDCDCSDEAVQDYCPHKIATIGYCLGATCTQIPGY